MRPDLLDFGGEENLDQYLGEFNRLYRTTKIVDVMGNEVVFSEDRGEHVCLKSNDPVWNKGPRDVWKSGAGSTYSLDNGGSSESY